MILGLLTGCKVTTLVYNISPCPTSSTALAAKLHTTEETGQKLQISAGEYDVDNLALLPDFIFNSGYSMLKYPPDNVYAYTRDELEGFVIQTFTANDTSLSVLISSEHLTQEFVLSPEGYMGGAGDISANDANFDGSSDFLISLGGGRGGQHFYAAFLWNPFTEKFIYEPSFEEISTPLVDSEHNLIWGGCDFPYGYYYDAFEFVDGKFVNTHSLIGDYPYPDLWEKGAQCAEFALENNEMKEVGQMYFPGTDVSTAVERYIEVGTVWPGWSWCDAEAFVVKG